MKEEAGKEADRFARYAALEVGVGLLGVVAAFLIGQTPEARMGALIGVAASVLSGGLTLVLKRLAIQRGLSWAMGLIGASFGVRFVAMGIGLGIVFARGAGRVAFVAGFFSTYLVVQWLEISYVLAAKERGQGGM